MSQITGVVQGGGLGGAEGASGGQAPHVFQALLYLRKLCSHPLLVLDPQQPQHAKVRFKIGWVGLEWLLAMEKSREAGMGCSAAPSTPRLSVAACSS